MKFSTKVFTAVFVSSIIAGSAVIWCAHKYVSTQTREEFISRYQIFSTVLGKNLTRADHGTELTMRNAAEVVADHDKEKGLLSTKELRGLRDTLGVTHIFVIDKKGNFVRSTNENPELIPNAYSFCPSYRDMITGSSESAATPIIHPRPEPKPYKFLFVPSRDHNRLLEIGIRVDFVGRALTEGIGADPNILSMAVYDPRGTSFGRFTAEGYQFTESQMRLPESLPAVVEHSDEFHFYSKVASSHPICCQCEISGTTKNGEYYYVLESIISKKELHAIQAKTTLIFVIFGFVMTLIAFILGLFVTRRLVRNIELAAKKVREMRDTGALDMRIALDGEDEVSVLTSEIDHLLDKVKVIQRKVVENETVQAKVKLAKEVAHNIKSPISAIEMMMPRLTLISEDTKRVLTNSVRDIRSLADRLKTQADSMNVEPLEQEPELLFLPTFLEDLVMQKQVEFSQREGLRVKFLCHEAAVESFVKVNTLELKSILSNLMNNAAESYGQRCGEIRVGLKADNDFCEITVSDDGAGIPQEYLNDLGSKRITFKGGANRGVGLLHAFETIESWGGEIDIESKIGLGTRLKIRLAIYAENESDLHGGDSMRINLLSTSRSTALEM